MDAIQDTLLTPGHRGIEAKAQRKSCPAQAALFPPPPLALSGRSLSISCNDSIHEKNPRNTEKHPAVTLFTLRSLLEATKPSADQVSGGEEGLVASLP